MDGLYVVPLEEAPRELFAMSEHAEGTFAWYRTLASTTLEPGERAVIAVLHRAGQAAAALPLVHRHGGVRALTAPYTTKWRPLARDPEVAHVLGVLSRNYAGEVLELDGLDPSDPSSAAFLEGLGRSGLACACYESFSNWYEPISGFREYWTQRPSRLKETVRRKTKRALQAGLTYRLLRSHHAEAFVSYEQVYGSSWKQPEPHPEFIPTLLTLLREDIRVGVMLLGDKPVAVQIWFVRDGRGTIFKLAHREDAADYSPGTLLTAWMFEQLIRDERLREIDFGRGDDFYKRDWLSRRRTRVGAIVADWRRAAGVAAIFGRIVPTLASRALRGRSAVLCGTRVKAGAVARLQLGVP